MSTETPVPPAKPAFSAEEMRRDFPILSTNVGKYPLIYLDNGATTQKPKAVIDEISRYYEHENANIHRGVHHLSQVATDRYEQARKTVAKFLNTRDTGEVIFTRGTTEAINLVAHSYVEPFLKEGDEVLVSAMEHHANIVPWQILESRKGIRLKVIPMDSRGVLDMEAYEKLLQGNVKFVSISHLSNALGTVNPVKEIIRLAHQHGSLVMVDAAQSAPHMGVDVQDLDCDFLAFSGHKLFGPTGIGVLYGRKDLLNKMPPYQGGGDMIRSVSFSGTTFRDAPERFEAGTPHIAGAIGLATAIEYLQEWDYSELAQYEHDLLMYQEAQLKEIPGLTIIGTSPHKAAATSFVMKGIHPHDIGTFLDASGIAVRTGHHCAEPVMEFFGISGTTRSSLAFYNTKADVDALIAGLKKINHFFGE